MGILPAGSSHQAGQLTDFSIPAAGSAHRNKKARRSAGPSQPQNLSTEEPALRRFLFDHGIVLGLRLRTTARSLGQRRLYFLDRLGLGDPLHRRDFA